MPRVMSTLSSGRLPKSHAIRAACPFSCPSYATSVPLKVGASMILLRWTSAPHRYVQCNRGSNTGQVREVVRGKRGEGGPTGSSTGGHRQAPAGWGAGPCCCWHQIAVAHRPSEVILTLQRARYVAMKSFSCRKARLGHRGMGQSELHSTPGSPATGTARWHLTSDSTSMLRNGGQQLLRAAARAQGQAEPLAQALAASTSQQLQG